MIHPFLVTNNLFGYVDGTIPCPATTIKQTTTSDNTTSTKSQPNPYISSYPNPTTLATTLPETNPLNSPPVIYIPQHSSPNSPPVTNNPQNSLPNSPLPTATTTDPAVQTPNTPSSPAYLNQAKEYADALGNIGEAFKEKYLVMLLIVGLHEDYNGLKSTLLARQAPTAFHELQGLLADHDYMIKQYVPAIPSLQAFTTKTSGTSSQT
ncbi:hypothetical protein Tco_0194175 [Tanacetum coccineum]